MYIIKLLATGAIDTIQVLTWVYYTCVIFLFKQFHFSLILRGKCRKIFIQTKCIIEKMLLVDSICKITI